MEYDMFNPWKNTLDNYQLIMFIDISTYCNAGCPACHRTDINGLGKVGWLPNIQWTLEEFKKAYPPEFILQVAQWEICGTWGDPLMNKDLFEMCRYIIEYNPIAEIQIDTNGSLRSLTWWEELGKLSNNSSIRVDFAVEGINQEMHAKYRRKTELNKVLANMKKLTDSGGRATAFCVVHKHNQNHLKEIRDLCYAHGAEKVDFVESNRFNKGPTFEFTDENGNIDILEQVEEPYEKPGYVRDAQADWKTRIEFQPWYIKMKKEVSEVKDED